MLSLTVHYSCSTQYKNPKNTFSFHKYKRETNTTYSTSYNTHSMQSGQIYLFSTFQSDSHEYHHTMKTKKFTFEVTLTTTCTLDLHIVNVCTHRIVSHPMYPNWKFVVNAWAKSSGFVCFTDSVCSWRFSTLSYRIVVAFDIGFFVQIIEKVSLHISYQFVEHDLPKFEQKKCATSGDWETETET